MTKIICLPPDKVPQSLNSNNKYIITYAGNHQREELGYFAPDLKKYLKKRRIKPSVVAWDFNTIALSIIAADNAINRKKSSDGWTRQIEVDICVCDPKPWFSVKTDFEEMLRFLTGDFWILNFFCDGTEPPTPKSERTSFDATCLSLLSGGIDSLIGGIDLVAKGEKPILISQIVRGDKPAQQNFAGALVPEENYFQMSHKLHCPSGESESSTRGRSIAFFSFAGLLASTLAESLKGKARLYVPENGFISLNIPLNRP